MTIALFGGTFDPVHLGHLYVAKKACAALNVPIQFLPCGTPGHRTAPVASPEHRLKMLQLAIANEPGLQINTAEIDSQEPSYTVNTLKALRSAHGATTPLVFILGADSFAGLPLWHQAENLGKLSHWLVVTRLGATLQAPWLQKSGLCQVETIEALHKTPAGSVFYLNIPPMDISSTQIRALISEQKQFDHLVPASLVEYIAEYALYEAHV